MQSGARPDSHGILEASASVRAAFERYSSRGKRDGAPFAVVGTVRIPERGIVSGILAFADNEFFAHLLCRELGAFAVRSYGGVHVRRTEWSPEGAEFDVSQWRKMMRQVPSVARVRWDRIVVTSRTAPAVYAQLEMSLARAASEDADR